MYCQNRVSTGCILFAALLNNLALSSTIVVPSEKYSSIQDAIDIANKGDIILVMDGIYTGSRNKNLDFQGKAITVISQNGPNSCIIDCENHGRGFIINNFETSATFVSGFTITNGDERRGGGMFIAGSSPTVTNCIFKHNLSSIENSNGEGGGIYAVNSDSIISDCLFINNTANGGGGIYLKESNLTIKNCEFKENHGNKGGGIYCLDSRPVITQCVFDRNAVVGDSFASGGGIHNGRSSPQITKCFFISNSAIASTGDGGGIANVVNSYPQISNCVFSKNTASYRGGGIFTRIDSNPSLKSCTLSRNDAGYKGGGLFASFDTSVLISNSVFWHNSTNFGGFGILEITYSNVQGGYPGKGNIDLPPRFVNFENNDFHLQNGSPCVDAGNPLEEISINTKDVYGEQRKRNCRIDIGANESVFFADCNRNNLRDACEVVLDSASDCNNNLTPDECDNNSVDCNDNNVWDACDINNHTSTDCNSNGIPDECEITTLDCNHNLVLDECDILQGFSKDCNSNHIPDRCDIDLGTSKDLDRNNVPDACEAIRRMYWTGFYSGTIQRSRTDGSNFESLVTELDLVIGIALDLQHRKMYWTKPGPPWGSPPAYIQRSNLDGTEIETMISTGLGIPYDIIIALDEDKMYWSDFVTTNTISRSNLDGSDIENLATSASFTFGLAVDTDARKLYWSGANYGNIKRANTDGTNVEEIITGLGDIRHIALDLTHRKIYWTDRGIGRIQRANLDGSDIEILVVLGFANLGGIALDIDAGKMYWTEFTQGVIMRASLDGSDREIIIGGLRQPIKIALDLRIDGDINMDQVIDLRDYSIFQLCFSGDTSLSIGSDCDFFDVSPYDGQIDLDDFNKFQQIFMRQ